MGDKLTSKQIAARWVNTIPGHDGIIRDPAHAVEGGRKIGYPVMAQGLGGGGGKGDPHRLFRPPECRERL